MVKFIDDHRGAHGGEPLCEMLPIAPATYYEHLAKRADPARLSDRAKRDEALGPEIQRVFDANWQVYGVRKVWRRSRREGFDVARCTVARLMRCLGIQGIIRGKPQETTVPDKKLPCPLDKVNRQFRVPAPNMVWVSDFTYAATWKGFVYVAPRHGLSDQWRSHGSIIDAYACVRHGLEPVAAHASPSGGASAPPLMPGSCSMPSNRPSMNAARSKVGAWFTTVIGAPSICRSNKPNDWPRQVSNLRSAASVTAMTMLSPKRSMACSKPRSSIVAAHGATSKLNRPGFAGGWFVQRLCDHIE
jgi:hypothetical protein